MLRNKKSDLRWRYGSNNWRNNQGRMLNLFAYFASVNPLFEDILIASSFPPVLTLFEPMFQVLSRIINGLFCLRCCFGSSSTRTK